MASKSQHDENNIDENVSDLRGSDKDSSLVMNTANDDDSECGETTDIVHELS